MIISDGIDDSIIPLKSLKIYIEYSIWALQTMSLQIAELSLLSELREITMRRIILSVILLHSLLKCVNCFKYGGFACGFTPKYPSPAPDEYSWTASLVYGTKPLVGLCSGSVINSRYVLTSATCVAGDYINELGGL